MRSSGTACRVLVAAVPVLAPYRVTASTDPQEHAMTVTFDPVHYKNTTRTQWEDAATAWHTWGPTLEDWLGEATTLMLDAAGITTGSSVLDVAAGAGGQSLAAAHRVGPSGQ